VAKLPRVVVSPGPHGAVRLQGDSVPTPRRNRDNVGNIACVHGFVSIDVCAVAELTIIVEAPANDDARSTLTLLRRIDGRHRASNQPDAGRADRKEGRHPGWWNTHFQHSGPLARSTPWVAQYTSTASPIVA